MTNNKLQHHGILGMKWGVRRTPAQLGRTKGSSKKSSSLENAHDDHKKAHGSKGVQSLSDSELKSRINRLEMEKKYKQLTATETSAGRKFVKDVVLSATKQTATTYVSRYMTKGIDEIIKRTAGR